MTLNRWQFVGIALSVMWVVGAGIHTRNDDIARAENFANFAYKACADARLVSHDSDLSSCEKEKQSTIESWMRGSDKNVAFTALAPLPLGWLAGFILVYALRIQAAGLRAVVPWSAMTLPKKAFTLSCGLATAAAAWMAAVMVMNLYVDTVVPVMLRSPAMVVKTDDLVGAHGTWINTGISNDTALAFPLQTSTIECNKREQRCTEARASVYNKLLWAELVEYDVQSWTDGAIVLKLDNFCSEVVYTIDLNTEVVSGVGRRKNSDTTLCKITSGPDKWSYRLADGLPVYWELRAKARPLPLRVFHSLFGQ